jgi:protein YibB
MSDISIVTAFFDIGRGDWTPDKGLPHYLQRTTDTYFERFANMAKLENEMVIYTSEEFVSRVKELRGDRPTEVMVVNFDNSFEKLRELVTTVQTNPEFQKKINPMQVRNPEYWNANYVVVNALKSTFVSKAIELGHIKNDLAAWLDFGYCREESTLNGVTNWQYPFDKEKIHFFNIQDCSDWPSQNKTIQDIIANNDVYITGPCIVAGKEQWPVLEYLVNFSLQELFKNDMIDDDQTLLLMSYLSQQELFELHPVSSDNWFVAFKEFNENLS